MENVTSTAIKSSLNRLELMDEEVRLASSGDIVNLYPILRHLPGNLFNMNKLKNILEAETKRIEKQIDARKKTLNHDDPQSYIDALLIAQKNNDWLTGIHDYSFLLWRQRNRAPFRDHFVRRLSVPLLICLELFYRQR